MLPTARPASTSRNHKNIEELHRETVRQCYARLWPLSCLHSGLCSKPAAGCIRSQLFSYDQLERPVA